MLNPDQAASAPDNGTHSADDSVDLMEAQLQQELRSMFEVDTQKGLQTYLDQAARLQPQTWAKDIQTLYRVIHTIKGGAVTVGADGILQVATSLEDLLSDLRHLTAAPPLEDRQLNDMLIEAGELIAATLPIANQDQAQAQPALQRLQQLRDQVQQAYLPQWSEQQQIQQDFAQQGLELVVLDLEIALEKLPTSGTLPKSIIHSARHLIDQLDQIGQDLGFSAGWLALLRQAETLLSDSSIPIWRSQWPRLFQALKDCASQSGQPVAFELMLSEDLVPSALAAEVADPDGADNWLDPQVAAADIGDLLGDVDHFFDRLDGLGLDLDLDLDRFEETADPQPIDPAMEPLTTVEDNSDALPAELATEPPTVTVEDWVLPLNAQTWVIEPFDSAAMDDDERSHSALSPTDLVSTPEPIDAAAVAPNLDQTAPAADSSQDTVQIPVPLAKLDQSAQDLINTLLSVRSTQGLYDVLQAQILQMVALAQEGVQYATQLRQIQEDYALLDNFKISVRGGSRPTLERYRQGYTTVNRLLETSLRLSELGAEAGKSTQQMADSLQYLDGRVLKLQTTVEESRLVPFSNLGFRARAILRDLTTRFQKPVRLVVVGERIELDVGTARSLEPALLHLIRNAFDHAIETVADRQRLGKPEQGTLTLTLRRQGNAYQLDVEDDGRGIDAQAIQARANALGLPLTQTDTMADLLAVICQPGFSSETQVSDLSGRGVGMDVVVAQIQKLGGKLTLDTALGSGTTFHLQFPVPHLLVSCVVLQAGDRSFAIPTEDIRTTTLFETLQAVPVNDRDAVYSWQIETEDGPIPGLDLLEYWQPQSTRRSLDNTAICVSVQSSLGGRRAWLIADDLLGQTDLIINPLPFPLQPAEGLMGVSLQPDGTLLPVLNAPTLVERLHIAPKTVAEAGLTDPINFEETVVSPTILIVDDAALMRRRLEASLTTHGHETHTCADGLEAWNWLQTNPLPALIITDIEMPNMDGFTLIDRCRQKGIQTPVLVVSSRLSEDWFEEARRVGATDYLTKGFSTPELLQKVDELMQ
ncbi:response regulator [Pseudanabaena sp. FACHB-2040]|uniref:response regulator n=1 Tax=Pseudanabaena sp. FACHB-2040 TaxID=2692859 RepID=UPI001686FF06|nr:response regulator [Pseudanabaena sp. FACHB-2040]MBD2258364.1 response regulator [Pseudanabaena sp. FACHB-2040]